MFTNETNPNHPNHDQNEAASETAGRTEPPHRAPGDEPAAPVGPGVVIPGESFLEEASGNSGERYQLVTRGKSVQVIAHPIPSGTVPANSAFTDYLNCTFPFQTTTANLSRLFADLARVLGPQFGRARERGKGLNGYERSFDLGEDGAKFCCVGQRDTGLLMIPGTACHTIQDWPAVIQLLRDDYRARITRWDGAVDDFHGEHPIDFAVERYLAGDFTAGGNRPSCNQIGNWIEPDGSGRTFYIGKRKNGKTLRIYEKGMECGIPWHPWVRWELELHNVDRIVPWEVLLQPGRYVAGAYPKALQWMKQPMSRIKTIQKEAQLSYDHLVKCGATAYGPLINVMLDVEGSPEKVVARLRRQRIPKRLMLPSVLPKED